MGGIQTSGTGDRWFTAPALLADGLFLGDFGPDDANPDIGDSAITETAGVGGFAMAAAPLVQQAPARLVGFESQTSGVTARLRGISAVAAPIRDASGDVLAYVGGVGLGVALDVAGERAKFCVAHCAR